MDQVILVDEHDNDVGLMGKMDAHRGKGHLHRAVSVLLYRKVNGAIELLLQKRGASKPLWPLYWSNTVCTHPKEGEDMLSCAVRRLKEEMGIIYVSNQLTSKGTMSYQVAYTAELVEYELVHVFIGEWDGNVLIEQDEVESFRWVPYSGLVVDMQANSSDYTPWFLKLILEKHIISEFML